MTSRQVGYMPLGEAPNLASRLSDVAKSEEILVSAATLGADTHHFEMRERRDIALSGKAGPLEVSRFSDVRRQAAESGADAVRGPLTPNWPCSRTNLRTGDAGAGREVACCRPAGVGKTRLIEQFLKETGSSRSRSAGDTAKAN